ncbi:MAG: CBS domain-containing protein [Deferribacteraceae bacterium]|jgi:tRNA nucleotidyltransferase (CCA-adding enzyme)|nr:CBS domain-containing protein [Deferribacteraceae bacterium]
MDYKRVVVTHVKADFDAIASAWAAYRLYDCDAILTVTDFEPNVYEYVGKIPNSPIVRVKPKDNIGRTQLTIVTDCKLSKRLGALSILAFNTDRLIIFDHHPAFAKDLHSQEEYIQLYGASTTIVVKRLLEEKRYISPEDAALYLLGIYEDTGLLTFSSTTVEDVSVVAELIKLGGDVTVVSDFIKRELSRTQVFILNELLINMSIVQVGGINITYSHASIDEYIEELAFLTHRMMEMEGVSVLFILVRMGGRVVLVGRSKNPAVDVSKIAARFGGGGHPYAASANIKDLELFEALDMLKINIRESIRPVRSVEEIMSTPPRFLTVDDTIDDAWHLTLKHNLNHMPIVLSQHSMLVKGIISRKDILQGIKHKLTEERVSTFMQTEFSTVSPNTTFREVEDIMLSANQKLVPVEKDGILVGVVTRTDLLRLIHEEYIRRSNYEEGTKIRLGLSRVSNITDRLKSGLPPHLYTQLETIGEFVTSEGMSAYLVGGYVRDLLMGKSSSDVDIVVEGDAVEIAKRYAAKVDARYTVHDRYKTAAVILKDGSKIDFASARTEYYSTSGAAPTVENSSLRNDLARRDFTINAMAVRIDNDFGQLEDYFGGQRDILDKKIRVLHSLSIIDDPSRAFRAVRFATRFDFKLGTHTEQLIKDADRLKLYKRLTGQKIFTELQNILQEKECIRALWMIKKYNMLSTITDVLPLSTKTEEDFNLLDELLETTHFSTSVQKRHIRFAIIFYELQAVEFKEILKRFNIPHSLAARLGALYFKSRSAYKALKGDLSASGIYRILKPLTPEEQLMLAVRLGKKNVPVRKYFDEYRYISPILKGKDISAMGIPPSKKIGELLEELRYLRLDEKLTDRAAEEAYVRSKL